MLKKYLSITITSALLIAVTPQVSMAEEQDIFTAKEFLTWETEGQHFYIRTNVGMAGLIVSQTSKSQYQCVDTWYQQDKKRGYSDIMAAMRKHQQYHPRGILLALMEKRCGAFAYREK